MSLVSLKHKKIDGARACEILDLVSITVSKQSLAGDKSAVTPSGVRLGTPCMTSRGFAEEDFEKVVDLFDRAVNLAAEMKKESKTKKLADFKNWVAENAAKDERIVSLKKEVNEFTSGFEFVPWPAGLEN